MRREGALGAKGRRVAATAIALAAAAGMAWAGAAWAQPPDAARQKEILDVVHNTCVTCHGPTLEGVVGPPITPAVLKDKDPAMLADTILNGRPDTMMQPFNAILTPDEAAWLVGQLQAGISP
jgi:cytochrome c55X